jgi:hypothetical protein
VAKGGCRLTDDDTDKPTPVREKDLERVKIEAHINKLGRDPSHGQSIREPITRIKRDGELLWVFGDADRHERRVQRAVMSGCDRLFWVTITIACGTPGVVSGVGTKALSSLAKRYGRLDKARNDLDAFYQYYRPMQLGDPAIVGATPGLGKSPGFFDCAVKLDNPTVGQLLGSIYRLREWIEVNQHDPEYTSFQFNFCFSGHGDLDESGRTSIVLADEKLEARDLASLLLRSIPEREVTPGRCRLDLYLDCCHSSAIARAIHRNLVDMQYDADPPRRSVLNIGQVYCACLDDEESFELAALLHSVFTFAFLNECSRKQPEGAATTNLGLRDVGWYTEGLQHPLLLDFTVPGGWAMKFPSQYYLTHPPRSEVSERSVTSPTIDLDRLGNDPVAESVRLARELRAECADPEQHLWMHPNLRTTYSREELLTNQRFPFL